MCPHWGVLAVAVQAGAWPGCSLWSAAFYHILPVNFRIEWLLWNLDVSCDMGTCISTAQARTKSSSAFWAESGPPHFSCKFPSKVALLMSLVTCGHAFGPLRLAQSVFPGLGTGLPPQPHHPQHYHLPPPQHQIIIFLSLDIIILNLIILHIIFRNIMIIHLIFRNM